MKRKDLIKKLLEAGFQLSEGGNHTKVYKNNVYITAIPRHNEIKELLAKTILKQSGLL